MLKNVANAVLKELGIENDVPFRVNEWKDKDKDLWIKVVDGVSYWDAGSNRVSWYEDIVLLRQLMDEKLTPIKKVYRDANVFFNFKTSSSLSSASSNVLMIKNFIEGVYEDVIWD